MYVAALAEKHSEMRDPDAPKLAEAAEEREMEWKNPRNVATQMVYLNTIDVIAVSRDLKGSVKVVVHDGKPDGCKHKKRGCAWEGCTTLLPPRRQGEPPRVRGPGKSDHLCLEITIDTIIDDVIDFIPPQETKTRVTCNS